jgi:tetratricopeptide (TPR) repeat protein
MSTGWIFYLLFGAGFFLPHGDSHEQILALSKSIEQFPDSTQLYLERGELYLLHEEPNAALSDFSKCLQSGLFNTRVYLGLSQSLLYLSRPDSALYYIDHALALDPFHLASLETKGLILTRLSMFCQSAEVYTRLIALSQQPSPSLYLDASNAWLNCPEAKDAGHASQVLVEGMSRIGRLHVLEKELVRVYLHEKRYDDALKVQTEIIQHWESKTKPYYERAEIYMLLGDKASAVDDLNNALLSIDQLPTYKSSTTAMRSLRTRIVSLLNQLEG